jgi:hypothetical protein
MHVDLHFLQAVVAVDSLFLALLVHLSLATLPFLPDRRSWATRAVVEGVRSVQNSSIGARVGKILRLDAVLLCATRLVDSSFELVCALLYAGGWVGQEPSKYIFLQV